MTCECNKKGMKFIMKIKDLHYANTENFFYFSFGFNGQGLFAYEIVFNE